MKILYLVMEKSWKLILQKLQEPCIWDEKIGPFQLTLYGPENIMKDISSQILTLLNAKGGGKGKRINAKFSLLKDRPAAETFLKEYFN